MQKSCSHVTDVLYCSCYQDVFTSVGGVESLFPLLEYVDLPTRTFSLRQADSKEEKQAEIRAGQKEGGTTLDAGSSDAPPACSKPSSVSLFLSILKGMLIHSPVSKKSFDVSNGPATLGCLLAKVHTHTYIQYVTTYSLQATTFSILAVPAEPAHVYTIV